RQAGEQHERAARRLPLLVVIRWEGTEVPPVGAEVSAPPVSLEPRGGNGPPVAHHMYIARTRQHAVDEAGTGPTGELVQEQGRALRRGPTREERTEALGEPGHGVGRLEVAGRLGDQWRDFSAEGAVASEGAKRSRPFCVADGGRRRYRPN